MNVHTGRQPTPAESALVDAFVDRMGELPGDGEIASARDNAIEALKTQGLPSRRVEAWHYTDLRTLLRSVAAYDGDSGNQSLAAGYRRFGGGVRLQRRGRFSIHVSKVSNSRNSATSCPMAR